MPDENSTLKILTPDEIKSPKPEELDFSKPDDPRDYVLDPDNIGGPSAGSKIIRGPYLNPSGDWTGSITEFELQFNRWFNQFSCVTQAAWNKIQCLVKFQFNKVLDKSKRWTAKKSKTVPRSGNSVANVVECIRTMGGVPEEAWPTNTENMTEAEFYKETTPEVDAKEDFKDEYGYLHEWLARKGTFSALSEIHVLQLGLKYSPVMVTVDANYMTFDKDGNVAKNQNRALEYNHEVLIVKDEVAEKGRFLILDSQNKGLVPFRADYPFGYAKIGEVKKKTMTHPFIKYGNRILFLAVSGKYAGLYLDYDDGDVYKALNGASYASVKPVTVTELPPNTANKKVKVVDN